jgi:hypothetical protein
LSPAKVDPGRSEADALIVINPGIERFERKTSR